VAAQDRLGRLPGGAHTECEATPGANRRGIPWCGLCGWAARGGEEPWREDEQQEE